MILVAICTIDFLQEWFGKPRAKASIYVVGVTWEAEDGFKGDFICSRAIFSCCCKVRLPRKTSALFHHDSRDL